MKGNFVLLHRPALRHLGFPSLTFLSVIDFFSPIVLKIRQRVAVFVRV